MDEIKRQRLISLGLNPDEWVYESDLPAVQTPTKSVVTAKPSTLGAFGGSLARGAPSATVGSGVAVGLGGALTASGVGAPVGVPLTLIAAGLSAYGTRKLQEAVAPSIIPGYSETQQAQLEAHPIASLAGEITSNIFGGVGPSIRNIPRAARALAKVPRVGGLRNLPTEELQNLSNVGLGGVLAPAQQLVISGITGEDIPSPWDLLLSGTIGSVFSKPNIIGRNVFRFPKIGPEQREFSREGTRLAHLTGQPIAGRPAISAKPGMGEVRQFGDIPRGVTITPEGEFKSGISEVPFKSATDSALAILNATKYRADDFAKAQAEKIAQDHAEYLLNAIFPDSVKSLTSNQLRIVKASLIKSISEGQITPSEILTPEGSPNKNVNAQVMRMIDNATRPLSEGERIQEGFEQPESEIPLGEQLRSKGVSTVPTESWHEIFNRLGLARGIRLTKDFDLVHVDKDTGKETPIAGAAYVRNGIEEAIAKINPDKAGLDTWPHEMFHIFYQDLLSSPDKFDNRIAREGQRKLGETEAYKNWAAKVPKGYSATPHEFLTKTVGADAVRHIFDTESKFGGWFSDFWSYVKARYAPGKATEADYVRLLRNKLLYDKAGQFEPTKPQAAARVAQPQRRIDRPVSKVFEQDEPDYSRNIPAIENENVNDPIISLKSSGNDLERYTQWLIDVKRIPVEEAYRHIKNLRTQLGTFEKIGGEPVYKGRRPLEQDEPEVQRLKEHTEKSVEAYEKYRDTEGPEGRIPQNLMSFRRSSSTLSAYAKFLHDVKGLTHSEALEEINRLSAHQDRSIGHHTVLRGQFEDVVTPRDIAEDIGARTEQSIPIGEESLNDEYRIQIREAEQRMRETMARGEDLPVRIEESTFTPELRQAADEYRQAREARLNEAAERSLAEVRRISQQGLEQPESEIPPGDSEYFNRRMRRRQRDEESEGKMAEERPIDLTNYYKFLVEHRGKSEIEASKIVKELERRLRKGEYGDASDVLEQPFSDLTPEEQLKGNVKPPGPDEPEYGNFNIKIPAADSPRGGTEAIMKFNARHPSHMREYEKWLQDVKGLSGDEAAKIVKKLIYGESFSPTKEQQETEIYRRHPWMRPGQEQPESEIGEGTTDLPPYRGKSSFFPFLTSRYNKIAEKFKTPLAQYVSDNLGKFRFEQDYLEGQIGNKLVQDTKSAAPESLNKIYHYLHQIDEGGKSSFILSESEKSLATSITKQLRELREKQIKLGIKVEFAKGKYRIAGIKPEGYMFNVIDPKVPYEWVNNPTSKKAEEYDRLYIEHQIKHGLTREDADKALNNYRIALGNNVAREAEFQALRKAEGNGLPWELVDQNFASAAMRYGRRAAKDIAYFKYIQNNPRMREALGISDQFETPPERTEKMAASPEVQNALRSVFGLDFSLNPRIAATARLGANIVMGPGTAVRNIVNMGSFLAQYISAGQIGSIGKALGSLNESRVRAFQSNAIRTTFADYDAAGYYEGNPNPAVKLMDRLSYLLRKYQGRDLSDRFEGAFYYSIGEHLAVDNIARAKLGDKEAKRWIEDFGDVVEGDVLKKKVIEQDDISRIAKRFVDSARGTYSAEGLPSFAIEGPLAPFTALSRFSIEKSNTIWQDVIKPLQKGNWGPFLRYTLASFGVGALISSLNELLSNKRGQEPTVKELQAADADAEDWTAKAISILQLASYAGWISDGAKLAMQINKGKSLRYSNPLSFPLYTLATDTIGANIADATKAIKDGEDPFEVIGNLVVAMSTQSVQAARYLDANFWNPAEAKRKERFRDYRVFQELSGKTTQESPSEHIDVLGNLERKKFKRTGNVREAAQMLPNLIRRAVDKANEGGKLDIEVLRSELRKIKQNNYQTMPDFERSPNTFRKYLEYLTQSQGAEAAKARVLDWYKQNTVNKAKADLVPSL